MRREAAELDWPMRRPAAEPGPEAVVVVLVERLPLRGRTGVVALTLALAVAGALTGVLGLPLPALRVVRCLPPLVPVLLVV